jgi:hypothetical protein
MSTLFLALLSTLDGKGADDTLKSKPSSEIDCVYAEDQMVRILQLASRSGAEFKEAWRGWMDKNS